MGYIDDNEFDWTGKTMVTFIFVYFFLSWCALVSFVL